MRALLQKVQKVVKLNERDGTAKTNLKGQGRV